MIKQKLIKKRKEKNYSQKDMAAVLDIEQSQYSRRESGKIRISKKEWILMAQAINTSLEKIYEPHDGIYVINNEQANGNFGNIGFAFDVMKKYIEKLEEEIQQLKREEC